MSAIALQINVTGTLDGSTVVTAGNPMPAPVDGVHQIAVAGNLGVFDGLLSTEDQAPIGYWLRAITVESAAAVRAVRVRITVPGVDGPTDLLVAAGSGAAPVVRLDSFAELESGTATADAVPQYSSRFIPKTARFNFLNDSVGQAFGGVPVAGPHRIYMEFEPIDTVEKALAFMETRGRFAAQLLGSIRDRESFQAVAATATARVTLPFGTTRLNSMIIDNGAVAAAGESMVIDVLRVRNGATTSLLTATTTINNGIPANSSRDLSHLINLGLNTLLPTDEIQISRTYVAGGGPTPMTNTMVHLGFSA